MVQGTQKNNYPNNSFKMIRKFNQLKHSESKQLSMYIPYTFQPIYIINNKFYYRMVIAQQMIKLDENTTIIQSKGLETVTLNEDLHRCKLLACCVGITVEFLLSLVLKMSVVGFRSGQVESEPSRTKTTQETKCDLEQHVDDVYPRGLVVGSAAASSEKRRGVAWVEPWRFSEEGGSLDEGAIGEEDPVETIVVG